MNPLDQNSEESLSDSEIRRQVLELIGQPHYRPVKPRVLAERMGVSKDSAYLVRRVVRKMAGLGEIAYGKSHLVLRPDSEKKIRPPQKKPVSQATDFGEGNYSEYEEDDFSPRDLKRGQNSLKKEKRPRFKGTYRRLRGGGGIVRIETAGQSAPETVFIPRHYAQDVGTGDSVVVEILPKRPRASRFGQRRDSENGPDSRGGQDPRGRIVEILSRDTNRCVGTYFTDGDRAYVQVDGNLFKSPIKVGEIRDEGVKTGDKVVLEITHYPCHFSRGEGVVLEVLGKKGTPGLDTKMILREYDLPDHFPAPVLREARDQAYAFDRLTAKNPADAFPDRLDLRGETIVTIDPEDARDFDDAVSLTRLPNRHWRLGVHIADVAYFVPPHSAIDREARHRSTSVYLPDLVIPMIPEVISNSLASLQPNKDRPTRSVFLEFSAAGVLHGVEIRKSVIRSCRRFSYEEVDSFLENPASAKESLPKEVAVLLPRMATLARTLRERRIKNGAIELEFPDLKIVLDEESRVIGAIREVQTESRRIIEEFMLAANMAVARYLADHQAPFLRRVHPEPSPKKLEAFVGFLRSLPTSSVGPVDSLGSTGDRFAFQEILRRVRGTAEEDAVQLSLLRAMSKAIYSPERAGHYALSVADYCHFTSPIRRYPDLTIHQLLDLLEKEEPPLLHGRELRSLGEHASQREQRAEEAERELKKLKLIDFMSRQIGRKMEGIVTGVERFGFFVRGTDVPAEGLVRLESLHEDRYQFDPLNRTLTGFKKGNIIRMGDPVTVEVFRADPDARRLDFLFVEKKAVTSKESGRRKKTSAEKSDATEKKGVKGTRALKKTKKGRRS